MSVCLELQKPSRLSKQVRIAIPKNIGEKVAPMCNELWMRYIFNQFDIVSNHIAAHNCGYSSTDVRDEIPDGNVCIVDGCDVIESGFEMREVVNRINCSGSGVGIKAGQLARLMRTRTCKRQTVQLYNTN